MSKLSIQPWLISTSSKIDDFCESIFFIGNGHLGMRGFPGWRRKAEPNDHVIFKAGFFSHIRLHITDMVQLPDVTTLYVQGETVDVVEQKLDLYSGVVTYNWETQTAQYMLERAVSMADSQLILVKLSIKAKKHLEFDVHAFADARVKNLPVHDDQMIMSKDLVEILQTDSLTRDRLDMHTLSENTPISLSWQILSDRSAARIDEILEESVQTTLLATLEQGDSWTVEKRIRVLVKEETENKDAENPWLENRKAWGKLWEDCDIEITADDVELQGALRYNIFQLLCCHAWGAGDISIGARGLTHGRYKGNTFWDTEIFMLPFFMWTQPEAAKNLLMYRVNLLEEAKALAKINLVGARYPWMCSADGSEQCESWDIGLCEVHITADIAYAIDRYVKTTDDQAFLKEYASEVYKQTGLYWPSRLTWENDKECYSSFFVKGPDEYCGAAVNNTYTNWMARHNMRLALLHSSLSEEQKKVLNKASEQITILYDRERNLYLQDELFERLESAPFLKTNDIPSYNRVCFDRMQRYRVIKQADLVLLMTLFPDDFTKEEKMNVFNEYEPLTLHDSTLSWGIHAQLALQLGMWEKAEQYFSKAVYLDLKDLMHNTGHEGLHLAAMGSAWQVIVYGAAGLWADEQGLSLNPMLPAGIHKIDFTVRYRGEKHLIQIDKNSHMIRKEAV